MKKNLRNLICALCALAMMLGMAVPAFAVGGYTDVPDDAWYAEAVEYVTEKGMMQGVGEGRFAPDETTTRAMVVTVLWRYADKPFDRDFTLIDVNYNDWFTSAAQWASYAGIAKGYPAPPELTSTKGAVYFDPLREITREEFCVFLYRFAQFMDSDLSVEMTLDGFADSAQVSDWAQEAMLWCVDNGIIQGFPAGDELLLSPGTLASRAEAAAMLMRFCNKVPVNPKKLKTVLYVEADCAFTITNAEGETLYFNPTVYDDTAGPFYTMTYYGMTFTVPDITWMFNVGRSESFTITAEDGGVIEHFSATGDVETIIK